MILEKISKINIIEDSGNTMYGVPGLEESETLAEYIRIIIGGFVIPLILIIGLITYNKKSKNNKLNKILMTILVILIYVIIMAAVVCKYYDII